MIFPDIKLLAIDPALANVGLAKLIVKMNGPNVSDIELDDLRLIETEKQTTKTVRQNSDDLRRASESFAAAYEWSEWADIIASEVPTGAQSARAQLAFGISIGMLAGLSFFKPLIQVQPTEVKKTVTGRSTASKDEMIQWAVGQFPDGNWCRVKRKGEMALTDKNEHIADACAIGVTATKTNQFKGMTALRGVLR